MGGGQFSLHTPLSLKWRQAWRAEERRNMLLEKWQKTIRQHIQHMAYSKVFVIYQTVRVFRSGASCSTLHVTAVIRKGTFTPLTARRTFNSGHFGQTWQVKIFTCSGHFPWTKQRHTHDVNSQVWQSSAVSPQQLFPHSKEQFGPVPEKPKDNK